MRCEEGVASGGVGSEPGGLAGSRGWMRFEVSFWKKSKVKTDGQQGLNIIQSAENYFGTETYVLESGDGV
jgi:hypothetical protein